MKKKFGLLLMIVAATFMTGCVKYNVNMDIKSDKSMNFDIIYAMDTSVFGDQEINLNEYKELSEDGFTVSEYSQDNLKGVKINKNIKNIDEVSTVGENKYSLSKMAEEKQPYIFAVQKGIFKNKYIANFIFDANNSDLNDEEETTTETTGEFDDLLKAGDDLINDFSSDITFDSEDDTTDTTTTESGDLDDLSKALEGMTSAMGNMDLSFNVTLPYKALSNNATKVENDGTSLSWALTSDSLNSISFEFELYNIYNIIALVAAVVIIIVVVILSCKKKTKPTAQKSEFNMKDEQSTYTENFNI